MERVAVTPTPNRFVSLLIDEFQGDWGDLPQNGAGSVHSPRPCESTSPDDDNATLRQSSPLDPTLPHSQEEEEHGQGQEGDLGNALRQVAAALASDAPGTDADDDPFAALRRFCTSPPSSRGQPDDGASARSSLGPNEDWDQEAAYFLNLLLQQQRERSGADDCIDPLLIAVEKMENRRLSLDPNWKPLAHRVGASQVVQVDKPQAGERRRSEEGVEWTGLAPPTARSTQDVDLPLLPPSLAGASNTPLKEKDAFTRSTPPLPVRGAPDRQAYLQNRVSTQKLAERITRATRLEAARQAPAAPVEEDTSADRDPRSPIFGQRQSGSSDVAKSVERSPPSPLVVLSAPRDDEPLSPPPASQKRRVEGSPQTREDRRIRPTEAVMRVAVPNLGSPAVEEPPPSASSVRRLSLGRAAVKSKAKRAPQAPRAVKSAVNSVDSSPFTEAANGRTVASELQENSPPALNQSRGQTAAESDANAKVKPTRARVPRVFGKPSKEDTLDKLDNESASPRHIDARGATEALREDSSGLPPDATAPTEDAQIEAVSADGEEANALTERVQLFIGPTADTQDGEISCEELPGPSADVANVGGADFVSEADAPDNDESHGSERLAQAPTIMSPSWTTPRPAGAAPCSALAVVDDVGTAVVVDESAQRRSMGIQVSAKAKPVAGRRRPALPTIPSLDLKEGHLRRISICEADDDTTLITGKIVRQRSKRIRIAPLAWWAGEHIEYSAVEGDPCKAKATAVYKVEATAPSKRKKPGSALALDNRPASARSNTSTGKRRPESLSRKRSRSSADRNVNASSKSAPQHPIERRLFEDLDLGDEWLADLKEPLGRTLRTSTFIGDVEEVVAIRSKEESWVPVSQNGYSYCVRLLLQTIRNTSVEFKLEPGRSKGQDQTRATQILLTMHSGEDDKLIVETWGEGKNGARETSKLAVGDWLLIPPKSFYDVANSSRCKSCVILAHVVACDNELFRGFVNNVDTPR